MWANLKNGLGNLTACRVDDLAAIVKNRFKRIQYRVYVKNVGGFRSGLARAKF